MKTLKRVDDLALDKRCGHPHHKWPTWEGECPKPGVYQHSCPQCGETIQAIIRHFNRASQGRHFATVSLADGHVEIVRKERRWRGEND